MTRTPNDPSAPGTIPGGPTSTAVAPPPAPRTFPFSAVVGSDAMALALVLTAVSPDVGGVLVRGEKGTAKSTMVRGLAAVLPEQHVVPGCRFGCDPSYADPHCPDGPHETGAAARRPARLVELPVGATEDRVIGSLDLGRALGSGETAFEPGLLAHANRGLLYVDEVNLLHDHLVDLLLDAAAMGRNTVERDGVSVTHAARVVLVGTMNPEEGELRPQLLDRFGLTVEVAAPRDPALRAEVVRRRLAFDADPAAFHHRFAPDQAALRARIADARERLGDVELPDDVLTAIAEVCAAFEVDGLRADIVTARTAVAHAAWAGRERVTRADVRAAALLALPHRRRRNPFDAPGLDEDLLDRVLGEDPEPDDPEPPQPDGGPDGPGASDGSDDTPTGSDSDAGSRETTGDQTPDGHADDPGTDDAPPSPAEEAPATTATTGTSTAGAPFRPRLLTARGVGRGAAGRRSRAETTSGRTVRAGREATGRVHVPATLRAAAPHQQSRGRTARVLVEPRDLRRAVTQGRESNLVLLCVDASGSMAARRRMEAVKTAVLSLLLDAYQRRDKVALVTFRGDGAEVALPPTGSVDVAARRLTDLPHGGRTPLAEGLLAAREVVRVERLRDPRRRPLLVVVTDGRATSGEHALARAAAVARHLAVEGVEAVVIDCESGRFRLGLAAKLAADLRAEHVPVDEMASGGAGVAAAVVDAVTAHAARREVA